MKYTLKHRLIGAAVLTAIAVLFLPSFFKEKQGYSVSTKSQIPPRPNITPEEFKSPEPVADIEPAPAPENMFAPTEAAPEPASSTSASSIAPVVKATGAAPAPAPQPASVPAMPLNAQGVPDAWVVQVGSFTNKEAANKLRDELQAEGQKAYVRTVANGTGSISRVYIGPKLDRAQAQALKVQMDKRLKVNAMVMRFQP